MKYLLSNQKEASWMKIKRRLKAHTKKKMGSTDDRQKEQKEHIVKGTEKLPFFEWEFLYLAFLGVSFLKILKHTMTYAIACSFSFTILFIFTVNAVKYI